MRQCSSGKRPVTKNTITTWSKYSCSRSQLSRSARGKDKCLIACRAICRVPTHINKESSHLHALCAQTFQSQRLKPLAIPWIHLFDFVASTWYTRTATHQLLARTKSTETEQRLTGEGGGTVKSHPPHQLSGTWLFQVPRSIHKFSNENRQRQSVFRALQRPRRRRVQQLKLTAAGVCMLQITNRLVGVEWQLNGALGPQYKTNNVSISVINHQMSYCISISCLSNNNSGVGARARI